MNIDLLSTQQVNQDLNSQYYYGHGKLLLTGEYFVLDGAKALALPTRFGQSLHVRYENSFAPKLTWKSYDHDGNLWFESEFEFWRFNLKTENPSDDELLLQRVLRQARKQNPHFLRDNVDVIVETRLGFPLSWGLGSSSTLIFNIAQWAYISPFELLFNTHGGSGYDIACAGSDGPIFYQKKNSGQNWGPVNFDPVFKDKLYFVYLGEKQDSRRAIRYYQDKRPFELKEIAEFSKISEKILQTDSFEEFVQLLGEHENMVSQKLDMPPVKLTRFSDFNGLVKSLGAWGGDFALVASSEPKEVLKKYFLKKGHDIFLSYDEMILPTPSLNDSSFQHETNDLIH